MRERLERFAHHEEAKHLRLRGEREHEWRHGDQATSRPSYFPRPVEERELVRHKTFAVGEMTPDEAVADLEVLDHDFYLFKNRETGEDNVVARAAGGPDTSCSSPRRPAHSPRPPRRSGAARLDRRRSSPEDAVRLLDLGDLPFVFFVDPETRRGQVLYRRYDGHYGLVTPVEDAP